MPFVGGQFTRIYGDGSLNALPDRSWASKVLREVDRVLAPGGIVAMRCFASDQVKSKDDLIGAPPLGLTLAAHRMSITLAMAEGPHFTVRPSDVLAAIEAAHGSSAAFLEAAGLDPSGAGILEASRGSDLSYFFPPRQIFGDLAEECGFTAQFVETTGYDRADLCPLMVLTR